jgi:hypothetical protein
MMKKAKYFKEVVLTMEEKEVEVLQTLQKEEEKKEKNIK